MKRKINGLLKKFWKKKNKKLKREKNIKNEKELD